MLFAGSILAHGALLLLSVQFAEPLSQASDTESWVPVEMVQVSPEALAPAEFSQVAPTPAAPAPPESASVPQPAPPPTIAQRFDTSSIAVPTPQASVSDVEPVPSPTVTPSPPPSTAPPSPSPSVTASEPTPSPSATAPLPTAEDEPPPTANVQAIAEPSPDVLPEGAEAGPTGSPSENPLLPPVDVSTDAPPAQVRVTLTLTELTTDSEQPISVPISFLYEPNPALSACPTITPEVVRQLGTPIELQADLDETGALMNLALAADAGAQDEIYVSFLQCAIAEQWQRNTDLTAAIASAARPSTVSITATAEATSSNP